MNLPRELQELFASLCKQRAEEVRKGCKECKDGLIDKGMSIRPATSEDKKRCNPFDVFSDPTHIKTHHLESCSLCTPEHERWLDKGKRYKWTDEREPMVGRTDLVSLLDKPESNLNPTYSTVESIKAALVDCEVWEEFCRWLLEKAKTHEEFIETLTDATLLAQAVIAWGKERG